MAGVPAAPPPSGSAAGDKKLCRCERLGDFPLQIRCVSGDGVELVLERINKWPSRWLARAGDDVRYFTDVYTNAFLEYAAHRGFDKWCIARELDKIVSPPMRHVSSRQPGRKYHPVRDYLPGVGPVLLAGYVDDMGTPRFAVLVKQGGRLRALDPSTPLQDEVGEVIYPAKRIPERLDEMMAYFPHLPLLKSLYHSGEVNIPRLIREVEQVLKSHITLPADKYYTAVATYIVASHFFPIFKHFTVLRIGKPGFNAGGTTTLKLICALLPGGLLVVDPSDATYYNFADKFRLSLCIDEVKSEWGREKVQKLAYYIDASFDRDPIIPRMMRGGERPELFKPFGPRVIVDPQALVTSYSNTRRQLVIPVFPAKHRKEIPSIEEYRERYFELWHKLHVAFMLYADEVRERYANLDKLYADLDGSVLQVYGPILAVASFDAEISAAVLHVIKESVEASETLKLQADPTKLVLHKIYTLLYDEAEKVCRLETEAEDPRKHIAAWRLDKLRDELREELTEIHQIDVRGREKRQWRRLKEDNLDAILGRQTFPALLRQYLADYVKPDSRRYLWLEFHNVEELWGALRRLAEALGIDFVAPCQLESLITREELRKCANELAEETHEDPSKVYEELRSDPGRRVKLCIQRTEKPKEPPAESVQDASESEQVVEQGQRGELPGAVHVDIKVNVGSGEGVEAQRRGGGCPPGWVFEENVKRCVRSW
ncbi:hypothetical protein ODS41_04380 [Pyrobaculum sp. 3827-6]|uniref:hypothetical protein n=1 Tax=Pyrobaculum sp. 3827-6 TaxID=2983604 RepID=UPI0021DA5C0A|nr:hypothetical protein [Pyrobaculum sp. 3827-6]MCU7787160.1 hypothetical protein [Pyrobaculum sp. 3827-6]